MNIVVLYNDPDTDATVEDLDVLVQRDAVMEALQRQGHTATPLGCTLNLQAAQQQLRELKPDIVFNLVEALGGTDRLMSAATLLLESMNIPFTGARTSAILTTSNKPVAKQRMRSAGIPTPDWRVTNSVISDTQVQRCRWIVKPIWEHASLGMTDDAVIEVASDSEVIAALQSRSTATGRPHFAEQFVEGREFNLSVLAGQVLPPAEIDFSSFPVDKPRIVGHSAKWDADSFEYHQTPRSFDFSTSDSPLLEHLTRIAEQCWKVFELQGYARVDFRVDSAGQPWVLEINANPCLSPNAGFAAALDRAGICYEDAVRQIIEDV